MPLNEGKDATASGSMQPYLQVDARARSSKQTDAESNSVKVAELSAQVIGLTSQLEQAQEINQFLRDEIVSSRGQRCDVVKIAEQMLGTLETIAIGGRLERPKPQQDAPQPTHDIRS